MHRVYCLPNAHGNDLQTDNARFKGQANAHREVRETWGRGKTGKGRHSNPCENARGSVWYVRTGSVRERTQTHGGTPGGTRYIYGWGGAARPSYPDPV